MAGNFAINHNSDMVSDQHLPQLSPVVLEGVAGRHCWGEALGPRDQCFRRDATSRCPVIDGWIACKNSRYKDRKDWKD